METIKRVLVCPLDWGLGHATRCIPVIRELQSHGCEVLIASSGDALTLLKIEFPELKFFTLTAYRPVYSSGSFIVSILKQLPRFRKVIGQEHKELESITEKERIDFVISDNRYGCWSKRIPSIIITHQLNIQTPFFQGLVRSVHRHALRKFSQVWVPDIAGTQSLGGELTEARGFPVTYIGPLSRMSHAVTEKKYDVVAVISGPEPQRMLLENLLRQQLTSLGLKTLLVKGKPGSASEILTAETTEINFLPALALNDILAGTETVIARPGYSTIMDLDKLGSRAIFIPTPGQTEQEYLGKYLMEKGIAFCTAQRNLDVSSAIQRSKSFSGFAPGLSTTALLKKAVKTMLS